MPLDESRIAPHDERGMRCAVPNSVEQVGFISSRIEARRPAG